MGKICLLVLAAGVGKRYKGLKQVDPVGPSGEILLDYCLYDSLRAGYDQVVFVIRKEIEHVFRRSIGDYWEKQFSVRYIFQEISTGLPSYFPRPPDRPKPWGTGHAVLISRTAIETPFSVLNADDFYGPGSFQAMADWLRNIGPSSGGPDDYCFVGYRLRNTLSEFGYVSRGICRLDDSGNLAEVVEKLRIEQDGNAARTLDEQGHWVPLTGDEVVSMNFWGFTPTFFAHLEKGFAQFLERSGSDEDAEYFIPFAVNELLSLGKARVKYIPTSETWLGLTYPKDLPRVQRRLRQLIDAGIYPKKIRR
ncbi:MAG: sugar phosphate nucleotidyltransferase [Acidobacteriota bacterium]